MRGLPPEWKSFLRDNAYVGVSTVLIQVSSLLFSAFLARRSSDDFGAFHYFLSNVGLLTIFSLPGLKRSLEIEVSRGYFPLRQFLGEKLKYGLLSAAAALVVAGILYWIGRRETAMTLSLAAPLLPLYYGLPLYSGLLEGDLQFGLLAWLQFTKAVAVNLILLLLVILGGSSLLISLGFLLLNIGTDGLTILYLLHRFPDQPLSARQLSEAVIYARHLTFINSLGTVRQNTDKLVLGSLLSDSDLAIYSVAAGLSQRLRLLSTTISRVAFPRIAPLSAARAKAVVRRQFLRWMFLVISVCLLALLLARPFILLVYGKNYEASIPLSYILILIVGLGAVSMPLGMLFESQRRTDALYRANAVASVLEIVLTLFTTPVLRTSGILLSKFVARIYLLGALIHFFRRL